MHSWVFSETLKNFYLIFDLIFDCHADLCGQKCAGCTQQFFTKSFLGRAARNRHRVLTTEAHPVPRFGGPRDRVGTARRQKTWSIDVPSIGQLRPLDNETAADSVERFAQAADKAGHEVTEAAVQAWYQAAIDAGAPRRGRLASS